MNTFAKKPEVQRKALQKALKSPMIGKHGKRKETLLKEEVYRAVQDKILSKANLLIDAHIEYALTGNNGRPDPRVIELLLNRVFGKPGQDNNSLANTTGIGALLDGIENEDKNVVKFQWIED